MTVADVLNRAAEWLEANEWIQGRFSGTVGDPPVPAACAAGACIRVTPWESPHLTNEAFRVLRISLQCKGLGAWNDAPHRTKEEVIAALRLAAQQAQSFKSI